MFLSWIAFLICSLFLMFFFVDWFLLFIFLNFFLLNYSLSTQKWLQNSVDMYLKNRYWSVMSHKKKKNMPNETDRHAKVGSRPVLRQTGRHNTRHTTHTGKREFKRKCEHMRTIDREVCWRLANERRLIFSGGRLSVSVRQAHRFCFVLIRANTVCAYTCVYWVNTKIQIQIRNTHTYWHIKYKHTSKKTKK